MISSTSSLYFAEVIEVLFRSYETSTSSPLVDRNKRIEHKKGDNIARFIPNALIFPLPGVDAKDSGIEEIHQVSVPINDSIDLPRLSCLGFSGAVGRGSAVLGLVVAVVAELVTPLDDVLGCCHGREVNKEETGGVVSFLGLKCFAEGRNMSWICCLPSTASAGNNFAT